MTAWAPTPRQLARLRTRKTRAQPEPPAPATTPSAPKPPSLMQRTAGGGGWQPPPPRNRDEAQSPLTGTQPAARLSVRESASPDASRSEELMPGLGGRIETLTKAKISHLLDRAEDPAETLDYAYEQQIEDLQKVKQGIADVVTSKKRLQLQEEQLKQQTDKLDGEARQAMSAGREDLARAAIERKQLIVQEMS